MTTHFLGMTLLLLWPTGVAEQEEVKWRPLNVRPAPLPSPALKYQLLPELRDTTPGNAALLYQRAHSLEWWSHLYRHAEYQKSYEWLDLPLKDFPRAKAKEITPGPALREVDLAARREYCDWEMTSRLRKDGVNMMIPDVQGFREYGRFLGFRAREQMLDSKLDDCVFTLQTGLALSRHIGDSPTLVSALVGIAVASITLDRVEELIQQPGSPNLYWALTDLPRPFIDLRRAFQGEKMLCDAHFPELRRVLKNPKASPIPLDVLQSYCELLGQFIGDRGASMSLFAAVASARGYPEARAFLIKSGRTPEYVDSLPVVQVALMHSLAEYDRLMDEVYKWHSFPYPRASEGTRRTTELLRQAHARQSAVGGISIASLLIPATEQVLRARERLDRRIAALRCVEAVRLYAAEHGPLPATLADIKNVPVPLDPFTGREFLYSSDGARGKLSSPDVQADANSIRYEIVLQPGK